MQLRPDQLDFFNRLRGAFRTSQSVLGCAPTGYGKTVVSAHIARAAVAKGKRVIFTVHRNELLAQTSLTFTKNGIPHGLIAAGHPYHRAAPIHIASIDTLKRRLDIVQKCDLLVADECHLAMADGQKRVIQFYRDRGAKILGNSGSPCRLDGKPLSDIFDTLVMAPPPSWLIEQGFLSGYRAFCPPGGDFAGLKTKKRGGEYDTEQAAAIMDRPKLTGDAIATYKRLANGTRAIAYCYTRAHAEHVTDAFNAAGIPAARIGSDTSKAERKRVIHGLADGTIKILVNVELVTTGFDLSAQVGRDVSVETVILLRNTQSLALFLQMIGRALRPKPYPAIIIDHAGNIERHGLPDDDRDWDLNGLVKRPRDSPEILPPVYCVSCYNAIRQPVPDACPYCGAQIRKPAPPREIEVAEGELVLITKEMRDARAKKRRAEEGSAKTLDDLRKIGEQRGYKSGWAEHRWKARNEKQSQWR